MNQNNKKARVIAFYLPQFHPIPENDEWWGKGFTEWTNVVQAKPLFRGHYQPKIPANLGFYDLRLPIIREQQAQLAEEAGIEGFCYWHYWFGNGKQLLEKPFQEVLESGKPNFPFCLAWANADWSNKSWQKKTIFTKEMVLMKQTYSEEDYVKHFYHVLPAFKDKRYITVDSKPLFVIFEPLNMPDANKFILIWRKLAEENELNGIHFVGIMLNFSFRKIGRKDTWTSKFGDLRESGKRYQYLLDQGFDAVNSRGYLRAEVIVKNIIIRYFREILRLIFKIQLLYKYKYQDINKYMYVPEDKWENVYPSIMPNYDKSPRGGKFATIYTDSTPDAFKKQIKKCLKLIKNKSDEHKIIFLISWNEWGEGNYMEPDMKYGHGYLNAIKEIMN
jgi:hypothetical protein